MPVIGRLDSQVEEVLIGPVGRRVREGRTPPGGESRSEAERPRPAEGAGQHDTPADESSRDRAGRGGGRARAGELPVWML